MELKMIHVGHGNLVSANRIITIVCPGSAPVRRVVKAAREMGVLIDATQGRRVQSVIILDSGYVVLSSELPETISGHIGAKDAKNEESSPTPEDFAGCENSLSGSTASM